MSKIVRIKNLWVEINPKLATERFIDELEDLCEKYAYSTTHQPHYEFTFNEEEL